MVTKKRTSRRSRRSSRSRGPYIGPNVKAVKHHWGHGYAYTFRYRGETYSGQRRGPARTAASAIRHGQEVARRVIELAAE